MRVRHGDFEALGQAFSIDVTGEGSVDVLERFADLASSAASPGLAYGVDFDSSDTSVLSVNGRLHGGGTNRSVLQMIITHLGRVLTEAKAGNALHGSTLAGPDGTVLLLGPSGSGKSTLAAALAMAGFELIAEDVSVIADDGMSIAPYPRPIGLSEQAIDLLGLPTELLIGPPCGCGWKGLVRPSDVGSSVAGASSPSAVVLLNRASMQTTSMTTGAALARILEQGLFPMADRAADLERLASMLARADTIVELGGSSLTDAVDRVQSMLALRQPRADEPILVDERDGRVEVFVGGDAVVYDGRAVHLLNRTAAAVLWLHREGTRTGAIAAHLGTSKSAVHNALRALEAAGLV